MSRVTGTVAVKESGVGVPNVLIVVYDVEADCSRQDLERIVERERWDEVPGVRVGSTVTDASGNFALKYRNHQTTNSQSQPSLALMALAPEEQREDGCLVPLHLSCDIRHRAGRVEHFLIRIGTERLKAVGLGGATSGLLERDADDIADLLLRHQQQDEETARRIAASRDTKIKQLRKQEQRSAKVLSVAEGLFSALPKSIRESQRYVSSGQSVFDKTKEAIEQAIITSSTNETASAKTKGYAYLSRDQRAEWKDRGSGANIKAQKFYKKLFGDLKVSRQGPPLVLVREDPRVRCRKRVNPDETCRNGEGKATEPANSGSDSGAPPADGQPAVLGGNGTEATIDSAVEVRQRVRELLTSDVTVDGEDGGRATPETIQREIKQFVLEGGEADAPAYFDFHNLQIAFEPVWTELFDKGLFGLLREIHERVIALGGDEHRLGLGAIDLTEYLDALQRESYIVTQAEEPPIEVVQTFDIDRETWRALSTALQTSLQGIAVNVMNLENAISGLGEGSLLQVAFARYLGDYRERGERIIAYAQRQPTAQSPDYAHLHDLLQALRNRLEQGGYGFTIYAANGSERSVNYGLLATYRQKWEPLGYQVGELVDTVPLAPRESKRYNKRVVVKRQRSQKEVDNNLRTRREEAGETSRAESAIVQRAQNKTNFSLSAEGGFNIGIASAGAKTGFGTDADRASEEAKKEFREAVIKAAQEYKAERTVEINTEAIDETEITETNELTNPNDELPVTFLFFELQRRYRTSEKIHRVTPVVLVAQEVPRPNEIDDDWIVTHDWILRRVMLDDSFQPALTFLSAHIVGDEHALEELRLTMELQRRIVDELKDELVAIREQLGRRYAALEASLEGRAELVEGEIEAVARDEWGRPIIVHRDATEEEIEAARLREEAAHEAYERAASQERESRARLEREVTALNAATEAYSRSLSDHLNRRAQVARLKVHIRENILYYMQAIWSHEPPDQRFFRLHEVSVLALNGELSFNVVSSHVSEDGKPVEYEAECRIRPPLQTTTLSQVADLDNLLGFKGNYMIFPLTQPNCLTELMMVPYVDAELGLHDPDQVGNWTLEEFAEYVCCLKNSMPEDEFKEIRPQLRGRYRQLLSAPRRLTEEIIVPTGSLYIESLPGNHPVLENFKLQHRAADVERVRAEVRRVELENLRLAGRLLSDEYDDPDVDKKIVIEGGDPNLIIGSEDETNPS